MRRTKDAMLWLSMRIDGQIRSFKRDPDENVNRLIGRLRKKIGKNKEDVDVEFMRDEKSVLKLDGLSTHSALSRTKFIHVRRNDDGKTERFSIVLNPPHVEDLNTFATPVVSWNMTPAIKVENCDHVKFEWFVIDEHSRRRVVSNSKTYSPTNLIANMNLYIKATPVRNSDHVSGLAVEKCIGTVLKAPDLEKEIDPVLFRTRDLASKREKGTIRVATYNVMYDSKSKNKKTSRESSTYRIPFIVNEELKRIDADVIMLQEVQRKVYDYYLEPNLAREGYEGIFVRSVSSSTGLVCFFKRRKFELMDSHHVCLGDTFREDGTCQDLTSRYFKLIGFDDDEIFRPNQILLVGLKSENRCYAFLNAHLYFHRLAERVRALQIASSIRALNRFTDSLDTTKDVTKIVMGDLNST